MQWILIGYMFLFIHRPFEVWPALAPYQVERVYMLLAMLLAVLTPGKRWLPNAQHWAQFGFVAAVLLCWVASPWADEGAKAVEDYLKIIVFYVLLVLVIHDEASLRRIVVAFLGIMALYMAHSLWEYANGRYVFRMGITRLIGVDKLLGDPNSFGGSIVYSLPFLAPLWLTGPTRRMRLFLAGYLALAVVCIGLTGSRSSFVGLLLWAVLTVLRSRWRGRLALLLVVVAPLLWALLPGSLQNRFETIINPEVGPANAYVSGQGRIQGFFMGMDLWAQNPLTGCGPGAWRPATGAGLESHNLYGQLLGEMGTLGGLAFLIVLLCMWANVHRVRAAYRLHPEWGRDFLYHTANAVGMAVVLLLFEGNFGHNLFRHNWLWFGAFLIIAHHSVQQRLRQDPFPAEATAIASWTPELVHGQ